MRSRWPRSCSHPARSATCWGAGASSSSASWSSRSRRSSAGSRGRHLMLNISRAVQGAGGAMMFANSLALIAQEFPPNERGTALGIWGATTGFAVAVGPLVGGVLTDAFGWEWIFLVNVPIGAVDPGVDAHEGPRLGARSHGADRLARPRDLQRRPLLPGVRADPRERRRLGQHQDRRAVRGGRAPAGRVRSGRAAPGPADARPAPLPHSHLHRRADRGVLAPRLDVLDVPLHHALHPEHPRLHAARERPPLPAGVAPVLPRRAHRREARGALSGPPVPDRRPWR